MSYRRFIASAAALLVAALLIWAGIASRREAAKEAAGERPVKAPLRVSIVNGAPTITLDAEIRQRSGIETAVPARAAWQPQLRAYGTVLDPAPLAERRNAYAAARAQVQSVQAKLAASKTAYERARKLYADEQNVSLAQLQAAEAVFRSDEANVAAAQSQARTLAATVAQEWGTVLGTALIEGAPLAGRLFERREFLLQVSLPAGVALPRAPSRAAMETDKNHRTGITLVSPAPRADPKIQGASYFYIAPAQSAVLPGMNVLAWLPAGTATQGAVIPASAIVWWQDRAWAYRRTGPDKFARIEIPTDQPAPGGGYVVRDLPKAAEIVTRGAQLLLSEEFRAQIQVGD